MCSGSAVEQVPQSRVFLLLFIQMSVPSVAGAPEQKEAHRANSEPVGEQCGLISSRVKKGARRWGGSIMSRERS